MAYNDDQVEIDAMASAPVNNMANMSSVPSPSDTNAILNENVSNLRSTIGSLSNQVANLSKSTFGMAKSVAQSASKDVNIDVNGLGDRLAASFGGPIGIVVSRALKDSGIASQIGGSVRNGIVSIGSKLKGAFGRNGYDSQSGMINPAVLSKTYGDQTTTVVDALDRNITKPLQVSNQIQQQQLSQTRLGNTSIVSALQDFQRTSRTDSKINADYLETIDDTIRKSADLNNEDLINAINALGSKFESSEKQGSPIKELAKTFFFASKIGTLFRGKYTNDIQKSNNPLETQVSALLQIYRWQRLYGELTKKQLNELIKLQGGDQKDVVGKHGLLKEAFLKNRKTVKKKLGKLGGLADFMMFDEEDFDNRNRAAMSAGMGQLISGKKNKLFGARNKKNRKWYNPYDWIAGEDSAIGFANTFDTSHATYDEIQSMIDTQSSRFESFQKTGKLGGKLKPIVHLRKQRDEQQEIIEKINKLKAKKKSDISPKQSIKIDNEIDSLSQSIVTVPNINKKISGLQNKLTTIADEGERNDILQQIGKLKKTKSIKNIDFGKINYDDSLKYRLDSLKRANLDDKSKKITDSIFGNTSKYVKNKSDNKIESVKTESSNISSKLIKTLISSASTRDKKIIDLLSNIKSDTSEINSKFTRGRKKTPAEKSLEEIAEATRATANAEEVENKDRSDEAKRAKKQGIWDKVSQGRGGKEKGGLFGAIGKVGALLTKFPLLIPALIAAIMFPGATKSFASWMFGGVDRFVKGLTTIAKVKNVAKATGKGLIKGAYHMGKVVKNGVTGAKSVKATSDAVKAGAKTLGVAKAVRSVSHLVKGGNGVIKSVGAVASRSVTKTVGKIGLKGLIKRIPIIGSLLSIGFAISRFKKGEIRGGLLELLSGGLGLIDIVAPGLGSALSLGVDLLNIFLDNKKEGDKAKDANKKGVGDKAIDAKKKSEKLDEKSKKEFKKNSQKAKDHIKKGNKIRGAYYGYEAAKNLESEESEVKKVDQKKTPQSVDAKVKKIPKSEVKKVDQKKTPQSVIPTPTVRSYNVSVFNGTVDGIKVKNKKSMARLYNDLQGFNKKGPINKISEEKEAIKAINSYIDEHFKNEDKKVKEGLRDWAIDTWTLEAAEREFESRFKHGGFVKRFADGGHYATKPTNSIDGSGHPIQYGEAGTEAIIPITAKPGNLLSNIGHEVANILYGKGPSGPASTGYMNGKGSVHASDKDSLPITRYLAQSLAKVIKPFADGGIVSNKPELLVDVSTNHNGHLGGYKVYSDDTTRFYNKDIIPSNVIRNIYKSHKLYADKLKKQSKKPAFFPFIEEREQLDKYLEKLVTSETKRYNLSIDSQRQIFQSISSDVKYWNKIDWYKRDIDEYNDYLKRKNQKKTPESVDSKAKKTPKSVATEAKKVDQKKPEKKQGFFSRLFGNKKKTPESVDSKAKKTPKSITPSSSETTKSLKKTKKTPKLPENIVERTLREHNEMLENYKKIDVSHPDIPSTIQVDVRDLILLGIRIIGGQSELQREKAIAVGANYLKVEKFKQYCEFKIDEISHSGYDVYSKYYAYVALYACWLKATKQDNSKSIKGEKTTSRNYKKNPKIKPITETAKAPYEGMKSGFKEMGSGVGEIVKSVTGYNLVSEVGKGAVKGVKDTYKYGVKSAGNFVDAATSVPRHIIAGTVKGAGQVIGGAAKGVGQAGWGALKGAGQAGWGVLKGTGQVIGGVGSALWNSAAGIGKGIWNGGVKGVGGGLLDIIKGNGEEGVEKILKGIGTVGVEVVKGFGKGAWGLIKGVGKGAWSAVSGIAKGSWSLVKGIGKGLWSATSGIVKGIGSVAKGVAKGAWGLVSGTAKGVWNLGKTIASLPYNIAKGTIKGVVKTVVGVGKGVKKIYNGAKTVGKGIWGVLTGKMSLKEAWNGIKGKKKTPQSVGGKAGLTPKQLEAKKKKDRTTLAKLVNHMYNQKDFLMNNMQDFRKVVIHKKWTDEQKILALRYLWNNWKKKNGKKPVGDNGDKSVNMKFGTKTSINKKSIDTKAKDAQNESVKFKTRKEVLGELTTKAKEIKDGKFSWLFGYPRFWFKARRVLKGDDINPEDVSYFRNNLRSIYDKAGTDEDVSNKSEQKKNISQKAKDNIKKLKKRQSQLKKKAFESRFGSGALTVREAKELKSINQKLESYKNDKVIHKQNVTVRGQKYEVSVWKSGKVTRKPLSEDATPIESRNDRSMINKDIRDTNKLNATNKVYAHRKANEQLNNSIHDSANKTTNAIGMNSRNISNNISRVNNTVINNNGNRDKNDSMYTPTLAVSGATV